MKNNDAMHGYIYIKSRNRKFAYVYENDCLTVYSRNSLPYEEKGDMNLELNCTTQYVIADDLSTGNNIIFFVDRIPFEGEGPIFWTSSTITVYFFITITVDLDKFNIVKANFGFEELNKFFPLAKGLNYEMSYGDRTVKLETIPYERTVEKFNFSAMRKNIEAELGIVQTIGGDPTFPLRLNATLDCSFDKTLDIELLLDLYGTIKRLFCFLCHRKSVKIDRIKLLGINEDGKRINVGELNILFEKATIEDKKTIDKTVKYSSAKNHFSELVQLVSDDKLYFEHIPINEEESHHITVSSFILDAAAFEWTFTQCYGEIPISQYRQDVKSDILSVIEELPKHKKYNSKKKGEIKLYSKIVSGVDRNFSEKVLYALKDFEDVLSNFIKKIYKLNDMEFNDKTYNQIADDLQYQRNAYAHGDIDKEMKDNIISDTIILEWINYCMVFKTVGYSNDEIYNLINSIFRRNCEERKVGEN